MNINERVEIELTRHDLDLVRYQNGQTKDALSTISNLQIEIVSEIKRAEPRSKREPRLRDLYHTPPQFIIRWGHG